MICSCQRIEGKLQLTNSIWLFKGLGGTPLELEKGEINGIDWCVSSCDEGFILKFSQPSEKPSKLPRSFFQVVNTRIKKSDGT